MNCQRVTGAILNVAEPALKIRVAGKAFLFEDHPFCGPPPCDANGDARRIGAKHPFWDVVSRWYQAGKLIDREGWCVVEEPTP